jgi:hypothetical protein
VKYSDCRKGYKVLINPIGYLKLHRELFSKPIWLKSTPEQKVILITLLAMANFIPNQWEWNGEKYDIEPGQFITSLESIRVNCGTGVTIQNVRTALVRFEKLHFLTSESTKTGRLVTIDNWSLYQCANNEPNIATNKDLTKTSQRPNKDLTTIEEGKKVKNEKNEKNDLYEYVFNHYLNADLVKHKTLTENMKKAINLSIKELSLDADYMKRIIDRHSEKVKSTCSKGQYAVKLRPLAELFGQKKTGSVSLICADYLDEVYKQEKNENKKAVDF